ncbi:hypothetical protein ACH5RR_039633 [Cinchona calisaya]
MNFVKPNSIPELDFPSCPIIKGKKRKKTYGYYCEIHSITIYYSSAWYNVVIPHHISQQGQKKGSFGHAYRRRLDQHRNKLVAVKVLDFQKNGISKSFEAKCKTLRNIRHRNLVFDRKLSLWH